MKWGDLWLLTTLIVLFAAGDWRKIDKKLRRERAAYFAICLGAWVLSLLLVLFPRLPGPTQLFAAMLKPLTKMME